MTTPSSLTTTCLPLTLTLPRLTKPNSGSNSSGTLTSASTKTSSTSLSSDTVPREVLASAASMTADEDGRGVFLNFFLPISTSEEGEPLSGVVTSLTVDARERTMMARWVLEPTGKDSTSAGGRKSGAEVGEMGIRRRVWRVKGADVDGAGREARLVRSSAGARASAPDDERKTMCEGSVRGATRAARGSEIWARENREQLAVRTGLERDDVPAKPPFPRLPPCCPPCARPRASTRSRPCPRASVRRPTFSVRS